MTFSPNREECAAFFGAAAKPEWLDAFAKVGPQLCDHYSIDRLRWVHLAGQIGAETDGLRLTPMVEDMRYTTPKRVIEVFSYRLGLALQKDASIKAKYGSVPSLAQACCNNPELLGNIVYGGREGTKWMDGFRFRGRGPTQITHLNNYKAIAEEIARQPGGVKLDLVTSPELLEDPEFGVRAAFADWDLKGMARWADQDNVEAVSALLNTGSPTKVSIVNNMAGRKRWTAKAKGVWPADGSRSVPVSAPVETMLRRGSEGEAVFALQRELARVGCFAGNIDGDFGRVTEDAVRRFQASHGLNVDGIVGPRTLDVLKASAPPEMRMVTVADLTARGSVTTKITGRAKGWLNAIRLTILGAGADQTFDLGIVDALVGQAETAKSLAGRLTAILPIPDRKQLIVFGMLLGLVVVGQVIRWFNAIEGRRLADAQSGANLSK